MASSSAAVAQPVVPLHSSDNAALDIRHPTPDLQSLQGAYVGNIERLEEHAEKMSEAGSDLGEEIRKLQLEQKLSDSRRASMHSLSLSIPPNNSTTPTEEPLRQFTTRSRNASTSSYTNSIVDVVGQARWGGYSPAGYVTSPAGSLRSGSLTQAPPSQLQLQRQRSSSKASRLGQIVQTEEEEDYSARAAQQQQDQQPLSPQASHRSVSSFTQKYDRITNEIQNELRQSVIMEDHRQGPEEQPHDQMSFEYNPYAEIPHERPATAGSVDTTHKLGSLWQDFDGAHAPETVPEEPEFVQGRDSRASSFMNPPESDSHGVPPPDDGMVFYPAPVPRMLNLPQRLSKLPAANTQARRRTQVLESMQADNRKSGAWPAEPVEAPKPNRKSRQSLAGLPPQLRASAFFDQPAPPQEFEVKGESAEDTLNNILEAAAHAPVSAFTDHPFAGHVGDEVYGREHKRKSKANIIEKVETEQAENRKSRRTSFNLLDTRRNSNGELLNKLKKRNSSADLNMLTVRANESRMSLGDDLDSPDPNARGPENPQDDTHRAYSFENADEGAVEDPEEDEEEGEEDGEEEDEMAFGPPTTLLAELQMRKAQQKSRNLTAATAFPNGMHSTLLQLDAVAEIENKKRKQKKVNLAWEAQLAQDDDEDPEDDVPLGVLFPGRDGLVNRKGAPAQQVSDWDRPLGLIAQREMEENEPLSRRRTRLFGDSNRMTGDLSPSKRQTQFHGSHLNVPTTATPPQAESEEDEGETLAQRMRRMKGKQALDEAIVDVRKSTVSGDFAAEMMSQFGVEEEKPKPTSSPANVGAEEEETLGQRRARLQAEALARGDANPLGNRPPLRASMSMADVLGAHPVNPHNQVRTVSDEALLAALPQGSLLRQNAEKQEKHRASRLDVNRRISGFGSLDQPLLGSGVGVSKTTEDQAIAAKIQAYKDKLSGGVGATTPMTAPPGMYNQPNPSMPGLQSMPGDRNSFFPGSNMGMMGMSNMNMSMPMLAPQMNPMGMQVPMNQMNMGMGMGGMGMQGMMYPPNGPAGMRAPSMMMPPQMQFGGLGLQQQGQAMMMEPPMDPRQRAAIDRWRESVMH
ncbi:unnamed protein product [Periconia digitata]|uniref:Uncharacterized protein n=1 Tax=Periconia digitata TaxID=1303443 RepID=A0A9W4U6V5_9PLEO|nr:unnamed protein product [Periconia digitata]